MFELVKCINIVSKKTNKHYTVCLIKTLNEDNMNDFYKFFIEGDLLGSDILEMSLIKVGFGVGLSDGTRVYTAEKII